MPRYKVVAYAPGPYYYDYGSTDDLPRARAYLANALRNYDRAWIFDTRTNSKVAP